MAEVRKPTITWKATIYGILAATFIWTLFPFYWMFCTALKPEIDQFKVPPDFWPQTITFENLIKLFAPDSLIVKFFFNSFVTAIATVVVTVVLATLAGYALSRLRFRFRKQILISVLVTQMFPMVVLLIPLYLLYVKADLLNSYLGLTIAFTSFALPFGVWMIKGFIDSVPVEVEEAAMVDGCSRVEAMFKVVLPLATPGIVATGIFAFLDAWNNLLFPMTLVNDVTMKTLPPGMLIAFGGQFKHDWGGMMATSFLTTLPILVIFILVQRYIVAGLTAGAVKG
ncbi:carbohydrate ABC transporter permease [Desulforamulus ruminis]|uniref:Binding-protein-dependent transport systems inner membrane component n=1 Tax=Desulforamulus ruminis (strain ATCC 23193 / DSM 2154 / NCIMB 8452 / DL) TaxID=696281 RepID=F6DQQ9_DESRL|nr:carbohydrate ABC transporter permease [Desulforamulus ruminis]AEG62056.1 binding-protein-dependent transport systems inner membrane component [Desulforamulus ruminis DSM 2154]